MAAFTLNDNQKKKLVELSKASKTDPAKKTQLDTIVGALKNRKQSSSATKPATSWDTNVVRPDLGVSKKVAAPTPVTTAPVPAMTTPAPSMDVVKPIEVNKSKVLPTNVVERFNTLADDQKAKILEGFKAKGYDTSSLTGNASDSSVASVATTDSPYISSEKDTIGDLNPSSQTGVEGVDKAQDFISQSTDRATEVADKFFATQQEQVIAPARQAIDSLQGELKNISSERVGNLEKSQQETMALLNQMRQEANTVFDAGRLREMRARSQMAADQGFATSEQGDSISQQLMSDYNEKMDAKKVELQQQATAKQLDALQEYTRALDGIKTQDNVDANTVNNQMQQLYSAYSNIINGYQNNVTQANQWMNQNLLGNMMQVAQIDLEDKAARQQAATQYNISADNIERAKQSPDARRQLITQQVPPELLPYVEGIIAESIRRGEFMQQELPYQISNYIDIARKQQMNEANAPAGAGGSGGGGGGGSYTPPNPSETPPNPSETPPNPSETPPGTEGMTPLYDSEGNIGGYEKILPDGTREFYDSEGNKAEANPTTATKAAVDGSTPNKTQDGNTIMSGSIPLSSLKYQDLADTKMAQMGGRRKAPEGLTGRQVVGPDGRFVYYVGSDGKVYDKGGYLSNQKFPGLAK